MPRCLLVLLLLCGVADAYALSVRECVGAHGERVFSDRGDCSEVRRWHLPEPPPQLAPAAAEESSSRAPRERSRRARPAGERRDSYLCATATRSWYQHTPCRSGSGGRREAVRQQRVTRAHACREIARPAAALRRGSEQDQRTSPYDKAMGRDPCR